MEYYIDITFEDPFYKAIVRLFTSFIVKDEYENELFIQELVDGLKRRKVTPLNIISSRIDNDIELRQSCYEYHKIFKSKANASIEIEQFILENPNQYKSLVDNLTEKLFNGENSTAKIGEKYSLPVRVSERKTGNPIEENIYFFAIEHLIPKE